MGKIRGLHTSPGIYTRVTTLRKRGLNHVAPASTANANAGGGSGSYSPRFYFGYLPITSFNGEITDESLAELLSLTGDEIKNINTVKEKSTSKTSIDLDEVNIPSELSVQEFNERIGNGESYSEIADSYNDCVILMVPTVRYTSSNFDIVDKITGFSLKDIFIKVNDVTVNNSPYVLLCMFNNLWSYARVGEDKVISPLMLKFKL